MDPFEETLQRIFAEGEKREEAIKARRNKVTVFLLGPGSPDTEKQRRLNLARNLRSRGIKVIIMEELPDRMSPTFSEKFLEIVGQFDPDLYIAIFTKVGRVVGLTFELGMLTALLGPKKVLTKLRYCVEIGTDEESLMTAYVIEQLPRAGTVHFPHDPGLFRLVLNFVDNYIMDQGWA